METYKISANTRRDDNGYAWAMIQDRTGDAHLPMAVFRALTDIHVESRSESGCFIGAKCSPDTLLATISIVYTGDPGNMRLERIDDRHIDAAIGCNNTGPVLTLALDVEGRY